MYSLLILPGDGIGPEVMVEVRRVIEWFVNNKGLKLDITEDLVGGAAFDKHGTPLHEKTLEKALEVDAVLLGAVGGPKYDNLDFNLKPERALLKLSLMFFHAVVPHVYQVLHLPLNPQLYLTAIPCF